MQILRFQPGRADGPTQRLHAALQRRGDHHLQLPPGQPHLGGQAGQHHRDGDVGVRRQGLLGGHALLPQPGQRGPDGRVVVATAYGGPEVLAVLDVEQPLPGAGQVLIEVQAAGTNPFDHKVYSGTMGRDPALLPMRLGAEVAGVVAALGEGVGTDSTGAPLAVGDAVIGYRVVGGYASQVIAGAQNVFARPENLTAEQAAGLLLTGVTAAHLLTATRVGPGDTVLIHGAAGGVGSMATQLAVVRGARVIGTASTGRHEAIRALGGEPVSYGTGLAERFDATGFSTTLGPSLSDTRIAEVIVHDRRLGDAEVAALHTYLLERYPP